MTGVIYLLTAELGLALILFVRELRRQLREDAKTDWPFWEE
jgi:hypothetical protein